MAAWPSGLRRQLQALVRKGVSSNLTAVTFAYLELICRVSICLSHVHRVLVYLIANEVLWPNG